MRVWYSPNLLYSSSCRGLYFHFVQWWDFLFVIDVALCTSLICDFQDKKNCFISGSVSPKTRLLCINNCGHLNDQSFPLLFSAITVWRKHILIENCCKAPHKCSCLLYRSPLKEPGSSPTSFAFPSLNRSLRNILRLS